MGNTWDHEAFRDYVLQAAANLGLERAADVARTTDVPPSLLSKWFRGAERPSVGSLQKVAAGLQVPIRDLLVLSGRVTESDLDMDATPAPPPPVLVHERARELDRLMATLPAEHAERLDEFLGQFLESWHRLAKPNRRRSA